ncbi:hypothetical protein N1028_13060 [Herbiconiux sp. CPCC 203407]|uniref:Uncharacterized protein n=1 Tax=Herbiconiux oxytropis TaxID=2970915 RepID=A0AA41XHT2_9MICO|nr:hypothetical protein [Herbiconiux oxytropis]MCS5723980.1 hypothetical protein [Herbiconiux oxytropis]MCS5726823.1 hypothetical protein [Herbiconiux oxytropis]
MKALARTALIAVAMATVLAASGCAGGDPAPTTTVTVTAPAPAPSPAETPEPAPEPAPDPSAYSVDDPGTWVIDYAGIGPFVVGSTLEGIEADLPHPPETCRPGVDTYDVDGLGLTAVSGIDESDPAAPVVVVRMLALDTIDTADPAARPRTEAGIGLGSTVAELQAAYQELETVQGMGGSTVYQLAADSRYISFEDLGSGEIQIISVSDSVGVGSEYCGA